MTPTDSDLVALARGGSQTAFREIVCRFQRPIYNLIFRMVGERAAAEDLAQDTFLKAFASLGRYDPRFKLSNWLFKIAHNTVIDFLRRRRPHMVALDAVGEAKGIPAHALSDPTAVDPLEAIERAELAQVMERAVARLRPPYRQVIVLRYHEDLSHEEIAEITGFPVGTVKSYLHRARAELAEWLKSDRPPDTLDARTQGPATGRVPDS